MFIYIITNRVNGKSYVGQTRVSVSRRCRDHIGDAANSKQKHPLANAIRKYGLESFYVKWAGLPGGSPQSLLDEIERRVIAHFNSRVPIGYNVKLGGFGGPIPAETRAKISAALMGHQVSPEVRAILKSVNRGRKHPPRSAEHTAKIVASRRSNGGWTKSAEVLARISAKLKGRRLSEEHKEKLRASHLGKKQPMSAEGRASLSAHRLGKPRGPMSQSHKDKISEGRMRWCAQQAQQARESA